MRLELEECEDRHGRFRVWHGGEILLDRARTPVFSAARVLLARGVPPTEQMTFRWKGTGSISYRGTIGGLAKLTVEENREIGPRVRAFRVFGGQKGEPDED
jgi:hypothetical protein